MANPSIYRYEVPIDDAWHDIDLTGPIVHVGTQHADVVTFWAIHYPTKPSERRRFRVHGTGQPIEPPEAGLIVAYVGTTLDPPFVWHLMTITDGMDRWKSDGDIDTVRGIR